MTIELVLFTLKEGYTTQQFLEAADATMVDLRSMSGFLSRELMRNEHGQWVDLIHWASLEEALAAANVFPKMQSALPFMAMIESAQARMMHLEQLRSYE